MNPVIKEWEAAIDHCEYRIEFIKYLRENYGDNTRQIIESICIKETKDA